MSNSDLSAGVPVSPGAGTIAAPPPAVEVSGICRRYGRRWALVDVTFSVAPGQVLVVTGRNGSGKSTLLRVLSTAIRPDRGTARIAGHDITADPHSVRQRLALLSHQTYLYEALTALENLDVSARFLGVPTAREALLPHLEAVGLGERADDPVATFSAGMRKRLALARTLLQDAEVVMLDEPYAALDPAGFRLIDGVIARLRQRGATILMATHLLERGRTRGDQGLVLEAGRVTWSGPAADLPEGGA